MEDEGYTHVPIEIEINGRHYKEVVVDFKHILERHSDHIDEQIVMEIILLMRGLELTPAIVVDGSEFYAIHVQASDHKGQGLCWYRVRFKLDDEIFIRTVHRDRDFKPERIKDDD